MVVHKSPDTSDMITPPVRAAVKTNIGVFPQITENAFAPSKLWRRPLRLLRAVQPWCTAVEVASHSRVVIGQTGGPTDPVDSMF